MGERATILVESKVNEEEAERVLKELKRNFKGIQLIQKLGDKHEVDIIVKNINNPNVTANNADYLIEFKVGNILDLEKVKKSLAKISGNVIVTSWYL